MTPRGYKLLILGLLLLLLTLLRYIPLVFSGLNDWGFDYFNFIPNFWIWVFSIIGVVALIIPFVPGSTKVNDRFCGFINDYALKRRNGIYVQALFILIMTFLFYLFSQPVHLLGDGYFVIRNLISSQPIVAKASELGVIHLYHFFAGIMGPKDIKTSEMAFRIISVVCGIVNLFFAFKITSILSTEKAKRTITLIVLICGGFILLFFGYAEYYPVVWALASIYIFFGLKRLKTGERLIPAVLVLLIGIYLHSLFVLLLPSLPVLIFSSGRGQVVYTKYKKVIIAFGAAIILIAFAALFYLYRTNLFVEDMFLPLFEGKLTAPDYTIFSFHHLTDIFNEIMLVSPFLIFLLVMGIGGWRDKLSDRTTLFLAGPSLLSLIFLFAIDPKLAMARDWDLFSLCPLMPTLLAIYIIPAGVENVVRRFTLPLMLLGPVFTVPYLAINLNETKAVEYFESIIDMNMAKSLSSLTILSRYYEDRGETQKVDSLKLVYLREFPNNERIKSALQALAKNENEKGLALASNIIPYRFSADYHRLQAKILMMQGNYKEALKEINMALQLGSHFYGFYHERASIYYRMGQTEKAKKDIFKGLKLSPRNESLLDVLIKTYTLEQNTDSMLYYSHELLEVDSANPSAYYVLAVGMINLGKYDSAGYYLDSLAKYGKGNKTWEGEIDFLRQAIPGNAP